MKYYVVINGESSLNIQGLAIQSLPNISKPLMRSRREEIDGRDGDIITKLGYSAYDKTLKIGLWGNYDINQVIAFFNQEGVITFSNEPDKYYNFTILNREDYINQLEAFREASITIHCQPYKYELNEQPVELENEYVEETGTSLTFENSIVAPMNIDLKGNTYQNGIPTPSSPIPINNVSGDNDIVVCGKNVVNWNNINWYRNNNNDYTYISDNSTTRIKSSLIEVSGGTYTISGIPSVLTMNNSSPYCYDSNKTYLGNGYATFTNNTITIPSNVKYIALVLNGTDLTDAIKTTLSNSNMQLEVGNQPSTYEAYNGTTYNIDLPVENLFDKDNANVLIANVGDTKINASTNAKTLYIPCLPNTTYTIQKVLSSRFRIGTTTTIPAVDVAISDFNGIDTDTSKTITTSANAKYLCVYYYLNGTDTLTEQQVLDSIQIEYGSKPNTYTPYGTTPIELNKIGTYQDYIYKENDKWYLHKEIGKVVLNGSESWEQNGENDTYGQFIYNVEGKANGTLNLLCNRFVNESGANGNYIYGRTSNNRTSITIAKSICAYNVNTFKTWLANNNTYFYFLLATPTNTEITYTPLIEQLESIKNAMSKEGTTNVNQVNNDAPFIITASVLCGGSSVVVNNKGNIYSKPIMTIYGSGTIGVYLSDSQIFNINLGDEEYITLDTANMEAYKVGVLKNRLVSGDYNSFKLETGNNTISFTGNVIKVELENYSRWI